MAKAKRKARRSARKTRRVARRVARRTLRTGCAWRIVIASMGANSPDENRRRGAEEGPRVRGIEDDERFRRLDEPRG
jgi:hypothetical protein